MFSGLEMETLLAELGITHVVWIPDSTTGPWEHALENSLRLKLIRVCREGEAWPLAAGLHLGGKSPFLVMQSTGLFESGDALRNVMFDLKLPIYALIGLRNWLVPTSRDSAKLFAEPILKAWSVNSVCIECSADKPKLREHYRRCQAQRIPGLALLAEGAV